MRRYRKEGFCIFGDGGEVKFKGQTIAEIKEWNASIYRDFIEVGTFGDEYPTVVPGQQTWEGSAYIKWNKSIELHEVLLEISVSIVQLKLSNSKRNVYYEVDAELPDFRVDSIGGIPDELNDELNVKIKGTGEFPVDPSLFKPL